MVFSGNILCMRDSLQTFWHRETPKERCQLLWEKLKFLNDGVRMVYFQP